MRGLTLLSMLSEVQVVVHPDAAQSFTSTSWFSVTGPPPEDLKVRAGVYILRM